jgi:hypothetical protein
MNQVSKANELGAATLVYLSQFYSCSLKKKVWLTFYLPFLLIPGPLLSKYQEIILHKFSD